MDQLPTQVAPGGENPPPGRQAGNCNDNIREGLTSNDKNTLYIKLIGKIKIITLLAL